MSRSATSNTPWPTVKLGDVCEVITDGDWIESKDQASGGIRLVQTGNIGEGVFLRKEGRARYISLETFSRLKCTEIFAGDILVSRLPEPVGRACIVEDIGARMITAVDCTIIRFNAEIDPRFFVMFSQTPQYQFLISSRVTGTTRARISRKNLSTISLPLPPLEVQREIVAKVEKGLAEADALATHFKRMATLADEAFKAELDEAFQALSAPTVKLGDVCEISRGRVMSKKYLATHPGSYPVYSSQTKNEGIFGYIDTYDFDGEYLTWTTDGANAGSAFYHNGKFSVTNVCGLLRIVNCSVNARWLLFYLHSCMKSYVNKSLGNPKLMSNVVAKIPVTPPPLAEQQAIVAKLEAVKAKCEQLKAEAERGVKAAEALRKAVLAEAFER